MGWCRNDDGRHENPKLLRAGLEADGLHARMSTYSSRHETDGFVDEIVVEGLARVRHWRKIVERLVAEGLAHRDDEKRGWWVHDYLEYNPSHQELEEKRRKERERKSRQLRSDSGRFDSGSAQDSESVPRGSDEESARSHTVPIPSHPIPSRKEGPSPSAPEAPNGSRIKTASYQTGEKLLREWCESCTPHRRVAGWPGKVKILAGFLDSGRSEADLRAVLEDVPVVSTDAIQFALNKRAPKREAAPAYTVNGR